MHVRRLRTASTVALVSIATAVVTAVASVTPVVAAEGERAPVGLTGYAFDARCAPTQDQMDAWLTSSPFWGVGIYVGGSTMSCRTTATDPGQPHLDASWVQRQMANGWRLLPIWVGPQASCHQSFADRIAPDPTSSYAAADGQGRREATAAVTRAQELGIPAGTTLWYDLEGGFDLADTDCRRSALRFLSGWTLALHDLGYRSGVYSSISAGIHALDNAANLSPGSYAMPDQVWYAWYNNRSDTEVDPRWVRATSWPGDRVHQYTAQEVATYGGVSLTIDRNAVELGGGSVAPRAARYCGGTRLDFGAYGTARKGDHGPRVEALQCLLKRHARYRGRLDGTFDRDVVAAVRRFQRRADLGVTGKATAATWTALLVRGSSPLLKVGSAEESVRRHQRALAAASGRRVRVTGIVSDATDEAVKRYQSRVGLTPTGVVTSETWAALEAGSR